MIVNLFSHLHEVVEDMLIVKSKWISLQNIIFMDLSYDLYLQNPLEDITNSMNSFAFIHQLMWFPRRQATHWPLIQPLDSTQMTLTLSVCRYT